MNAKTKSSDLPWDDLRTLLAVARGGSLAAAARRLGVNHSTVFRRINALEARLGLRLFERLRSGYLPTAAGSELLESAERIETELLDVERRLAGRDLRLTGAIRLTAPDDVAEVLLTPPLARFRAAYPEITLELVIDNRMVDLTRREADIAVRPTRQPPESLVGRSAGQLASAIYGLTALLPAKADPSALPALAELPWIGWDEGSGAAAIRRWMAEHIPSDQVIYRANSMLNICAAARAGIGLAVLPCFLADRAAELTRLRPPDAGLVSDLWLLTHPDLRHTPRIRALLDALYRDLRAKRHALAGQPTED